ncbi:MAG: hypothetical protein QOI54_3639 [Actinomycetota bacterium]|nr:hypothetical protein [Actinomycetota bacterium]
MPLSHRYARATTRTARVLGATVTAILVAAVLAPGAGAHGGGGPETAKKRAQYMDGVSVPVVTSPNVRLVTNVPDTAAISGVFAKSAPYFYVSSTDSITVYDVSDPLKPRPTGILANLVFENEAVNYGEKRVAGVIQRFVLVGADLVEFSPTAIDHIGRSNEVMVVDVTDPTHPYIRSRVATRTNTHTVSCIRETDCQYAYTAGRNGKFSVVDLTDLDHPTELGVFDSPAGGPNAAFTSGAGHKWNFDDAGYGVHTGSGGSALFDVSDPTHPVLVNTTNAQGVQSPWNDFIHHNSARPNATNFRANTPPDVKRGNVLLVTEEDYENTDCATAGSFQSWYVDTLKGNGTIRPLDRINPVGLGEGVATPNMAFCSAHWFDYHPAGLVAQGYYEGGLRIIDVRDASNLRQYGYAASGLGEVWDAYWVPQRSKSGVASSTAKTNIVYTVDAVRGIDVYTVDLPGAASSAPLLGSAAVAGDPASLVFGLMLAGLTGLWVVRRRQLGVPRL